jgi:hypothetical protein
MASTDQAASFAVSGAPSANFNPGRRWYVMVSPSLEMPPFCNVGTTVAASPTSTPRSSYFTRY